MKHIFQYKSIVRLGFGFRQKHFVECAQRDDNLDFDLSKIANNLYVYDTLLCVTSIICYRYSSSIVINNVSFPKRMFYWKTIYAVYNVLVFTYMHTFSPEFNLCIYVDGNYHVIHVGAFICICVL